jgi:putative ABC transport system substrate-binding protein
MHFHKMRRREFITSFGGAVAWSFAARAQQSGPARVIGILVPAVAGTQYWEGYIAAFREELQRLGWSGGRNIKLEERWALNADGLRAQAAELVRMTPEVILAAAASAAQPMHEATSSIPIVFANVPGLAPEPA